MKKQFNSGECAYTLSGKGPAVMLIHGLCESGAVWKEHAQYLSASYRVLVPDIPGYGESAPFKDAAFSLENIAKTLFAVADAEQMDQFTIIGHSMGGYAALAMAEAQPQRINGISLFHSTSLSDSPEKQNGRERTVKILRQNRDLFFREVFKNLFNAHRLEEFMPMVNTLIQESAGIETETVIQTLIALRDRKNRFEWLTQYGGKKSYFIGRFDNVLPAEELINEAIAAGADYLVSETSGHMAFFESPEEVKQYLNQFLNSVYG